MEPARLAVVTEEVKKSATSLLERHIKWSHLFSDYVNCMNRWTKPLGIRWKMESEIVTEEGKKTLDFFFIGNNIQWNKIGCKRKHNYQ